MEENADPLAMENDGVSEQEEENCFSRIVKVAGVSFYFYPCDYFSMHAFKII